MGLSVWIRYVIVPGYTDDEADLKSACEYPLEGVPSPTEQDVERAKNLLSLT